MEKEYSKRLSDLVEMELGQLSTKGSLSPNEVCAAKEAYELLIKIKEYAEKCEEEEMGYSERSGGRRMMYSYMPEMYDPAHMYANNGRYSMGNNNGWNNSYGRANWSTNGEYSGHSIKDRMIDRLERMVDEAQSEYERKEIMNEIAKLKQS